MLQFTVMKHVYWLVRFLFRQWYSFACKVAENFTASHEPAKQKRVRGQPRKHPREEDLKVRVEGKELALQTTRKDYKAEASEVIFSLSMPNQPCFSIADKAVAIRSNCSQVADNLACCAGCLRSQVATTTSGKSEALFGRYGHIPVYRGSTV